MLRVLCAATGPVNVLAPATLSVAPRAASPVTLSVLCAEMGPDRVDAPSTISNARDFKDSAASTVTQTRWAGEIVISSDGP